MAVDRRRRGVDDTGYVVVAGSFEDRLGAIDIVLGGLGWVLNARPDAGLSGLVVDDIDIFDDLVDKFFIIGGALNKIVVAFGFGGALSGNVDVVLFQPEIVERFQDVECGDIVARLNEGICEVAADEAGSAGDKDVHS